MRWRKSRYHVPFSFCVILTYKHTKGQIIISVFVIFVILLWRNISFMLFFFFRHFLRFMFPNICPLFLSNVSFPCLPKSDSSYRWTPSSHQSFPPFIYILRSMLESTLTTFLAYLRWHLYQQGIFIITIIIIIIIRVFFLHQFYQVFFYSSPSDSKSLLVSRTALSIAVDCTRAMIWMISFFPQISSSSSLFCKHLRTVSRATTTTCITFTFMVWFLYLMAYQPL